MGVSYPQSYCGQAMVVRQDAEPAYERANLLKELSPLARICVVL